MKINKFVQGIIALMCVIILGGVAYGSGPYQTSIANLAYVATYGGNAASLSVDSNGNMNSTPRIERITSVLLNAASSVGVGSSIQPDALNYSFQAVLSGASAVSATALVQTSVDGTNWIDSCTLNLTSAAPIAGCSTSAPFGHIQGYLSAISGTGATVTLSSIH